jgi:hypothetical protein
VGNPNIAEATAVFRSMYQHNGVSEHAQAMAVFRSTHQHNRNLGGQSKYCRVNGGVSEHPPTPTLNIDLIILIAFQLVY